MQDKRSSLPIMQRPIGCSTKFGSSRRYFWRLEPAPHKASSCTVAQHGISPDQTPKFGGNKIPIQTYSHIYNRSLPKTSPGGVCSWGLRQIARLSSCIVQSQPPSSLKCKLLNAGLCLVQRHSWRGWRKLSGSRNNL